MRLEMQTMLWAGLGLDEPYKYRAALACFYLGYGVEETRLLLTHRPGAPELEDVVGLALACGLDYSRDSIVQIQFGN